MTLRSAFFGLSTLAASLTTPAIADTATPEVLAAWTQFVAHPTSGPSGQPNNPLRAPALQLRFVAPNTNGCDDFAVSHVSADGTSGISTSLMTRTNPNTTNFPVTVCALDLDSSWDSLKVVGAGGDTSSPALPIAGTPPAKAALPGPHKIGRRHTTPNAGGQPLPELRMVTIGDTGCRNSKQDCSSAGAWPFHTITKNALKEAPDLVVHAGDYRYYGGHGSAGPNSWEYWQRDLLTPARDLLLAAPWAFARGNHERCSSLRDGSAGPGYFYFLAPEADPTMTACSDTGSATWYFDVAAGGFDSGSPAVAPHRFVVLDTAWNRSPELSDHFTQAVALSDHESTWWLSHIPVVDRLKFHDQKGDWHAKTRLNSAMKAIRPHNLCDAGRVGQPACRPSTLVMSHDHMLQTVTFLDDAGKFAFPEAYIVGHGGVNLRGAGLSGSPCVSRFDLPNGYMGERDSKKPSGFKDLDGVVRVIRRHGYVVWHRSTETAALQNGWASFSKDADGNSMRLPVLPVSGSEAANRLGRCVE